MVPKTVPKQEHWCIIPIFKSFINYFKKSKPEKIAKVPLVLTDKQIGRLNKDPERRRINFVGSLTCPAITIGKLFLLSFGKNAKIKT